MLRGEQILCGTTTTGTGTLTLAATPPPGGVDFDVLARATGIGFANSAAIIVPYCITEYTNNAFASAKKMEKGWGTLTLGSSSGIANCTLARTKVLVTATNLDAPPATYNTSAPTAVSIGVAANTLVFIGASATDIPAYNPFSEDGTAAAADNQGYHITRHINAGGGPTLVTLVDTYVAFEWQIPMLIKRATCRLGTVAATGTTNAYARLYAVGSNGRPGKLLLDFGVLGTAGSSLNSATTNITSAVHATGYFMTPGMYFFNFLPSFSAGSPVMSVDAQNGGQQWLGTTNTNLPVAGYTATGGTAGAAPDPANVTGITVMQMSLSGSLANNVCTWLSPS